MPTDPSATPVVLGVDVGTSSTKGLLVDLDGRILAEAVRKHDVSRLSGGRVEMDPAIWEEELLSLAGELTGRADTRVVAVGISGMGPCVLVTDSDGHPLRPAILYGVDTRATRQIAQLESELGAEVILARCGSRLTTQAVGPKLLWIAEEEPDIAARMRRLYMPSSWLVHRLTGEYIIDRHSASQCTPLYDPDADTWITEWADSIAPRIELPRLAWPGDVVGVTREAIAGIPAGVPVIAGTIDAWTEAVSVGATRIGDLMVMYGTTMFLVTTVDRPVRHPAMWGTVGVRPGSRNLAGGLATSGAVIDWLRGVTGADQSDAIDEAADSGPGARGLLLLPYFAGERTPLLDPEARGILAGLTLEHRRGDVIRAGLEGTALAVRHNIQVMDDAGAGIERVVAVGGGTRSDLWPQIVSDVTGRRQEIPRTTIGAALGAAMLAAGAITTVSIDDWNPIERVIAPRDDVAEFYDELFPLFRELYESTAPVIHRLGSIGAAVAHASPSHRKDNR